MKTAMGEFIVGLIVLAVFIVAPLVIIVWIARGLQDPSIAPWEMARDQGWLSWTVRVNTNIGTQWLPEEERTCVSEEYGRAKFYGDDPLGSLDCSASGTTYHNIPVEFSGQRVTSVNGSDFPTWLVNWDEKNKQIIPRLWICTKHSDSFSCRANKGERR